MTGGRQFTEMGKGCIAVRAGLSPCFLLKVVAVFVICVGQPGYAQDYALDRPSTCNMNIPVYDKEMVFSARSDVAPVNPPLECIVYLQSAYGVADGRYRLEIVVKQLQVKDCSVRLDLFNGRGATGNMLRSLGCGSSSTTIIRSDNREVTVRFTRPMHLYQTAYALTFTVKTYADPDDMGTVVDSDKLSVGAIIGIVVGILALIAIAIILCWCCYTGYIYNFIDGGGGRAWKADDRGRTSAMKSAGNKDGSIDSNLEKLSFSSTTQLKNGINYDDPAVWSSLTGLNNESSKNFRQGVPRRGAGGRGTASLDPNSAVEMRLRAERETSRGRAYENSNSADTGRDSHVYEPYDTETNLERSPRFRKRHDDPRGSNRSRGSRRSRNSATGEGGTTEQGGGKETVIDDPGTGDDDDDIQKPPLDSDNTSEEDKLHRFESEADVDTIASQLHINAGVRASVPDLTEEPAHSTSSKSKKRRSTSPKSRRRPTGAGGAEPDPMGLPPEAFDPVFTIPTSQEQYPGEFRPMQQPAMPFLPYGMYPMVPGQQMYAYAYQTAPQVGAYPGNQGAYFMQSVPTADGDMQNTAFVMQSTRTPKRKGSKGKGGGPGHPGAPDHTSTPGGTPRQDPSSSDMSLIAAGAAPPDPGAGHRSVAMKSFADPDTGIQTTQVLWTDNLPDPSDPKPEDHCQVTRKTTTRVTTRSGKGDLPTQTTTLLDYQDENPAFLAPSSAGQALPPVASTPNTSNVDYYMGQGLAPTRPPDIVHEGPSRNRAIKDRITFGDSTA